MDRKLILAENIKLLLMCALTLSLIEVVSSRWHQRLRRVCYFTNWSCDLMVKEAYFCLRDVDTTLCSHIIYAFAGIDATSLALAPTRGDDVSSGENKGRYTQFNDFKVNNTGLKTLLSVGGSNQAEKFKQVTLTDSNRRQFAYNAARYVRKWGFDGLDLDWEYPGESEKKALTHLVQDLRDVFREEAVQTGNPELILSLAAPVGEERVRLGYDVDAISKDVDMINLMAYDFFYGAWDMTAFNSPLYPRQDQQSFSRKYSVEWIVNLWITLGAPAKKINLGIAGYGQSFTLQTRLENSFSDEISSADARFSNKLQEFMQNISSGANATFSELNRTQGSVGEFGQYAVETIRSCGMHSAACATENKLSEMTLRVTHDRVGVATITKSSYLDVAMLESGSNKTAHTDVYSAGSNKTAHTDVYSAGSNKTAHTDVYSAGSNKTAHTDVYSAGSNKTAHTDVYSAGSNKTAHTDVYSAGSNKTAHTDMYSAGSNKTAHTDVYSAGSNKTAHTDMYSAGSNKTAHTDMYSADSSMSDQADRGELSESTNNLSHTNAAIHEASNIKADHIDTVIYRAGSKAIGPGKPGRLRHMKGQLSYPEICEMMHAGADLYWDEEQRVPYVFLGDQWAGFDSVRSVVEKVRWAQDLDLGGVMFWSLDLDDFKGDYCGQGRYPLLSAMSDTVIKLFEQRNADIFGHTLQTNDSAEFSQGTQPWNKSNVDGNKDEDILRRSRTNSISSQKKSLHNPTQNLTSVGYNQGTSEDKMKLKLISHLDVTELNSEAGSNHMSNFSDGVTSAPPTSRVKIASDPKSTTDNLLHSTNISNDSIGSIDAFSYDEDELSEMNKFYFYYIAFNLGSNQETPNTTTETSTAKGKADEEKVTKLGKQRNQEKNRAHRYRNSGGKLLAVFYMLFLICLICV